MGVGPKDTLLALLPEELAPEPLELMLERLELTLQLKVRVSCFDDPLGRPGGRLLKARNVGDRRRGHDPDYT